MQKKASPETSFQLRSSWNQKYKGDALTVQHKNIGNFEVRFNPLRAHYMTSTQHAQINTDVFCTKKEAIAENEKIAEIPLHNLNWILALNTSPIEQYHSLLISDQHLPQEITADSLQDFHAFSTNYPDVSIGFNGWGAGASQKHLHAQVFFSPLPITRFENNEQGDKISDYPGICLTFTQPHMCLQYIQELSVQKIAYNVLFTNGNIFLIPRKNEFDNENVKRGFDSAFGKVPMITQDEYDNATLEQIENIIATLTYQSLILGGKEYQI